MMKPVVTGAEKLAGASAQVVSRLNPNNHRKYLVRAEGELWTAHSDTSLKPGERVNIIAVDGIRLVVAPASTGTLLMKERE